VLESSQAGCAKCYQEFREELSSSLAEFQAGLRHRGKMLRVDDDRERIRAELHAKRALLRTALKTENYEEAATLRDIIRELEMALTVSGREES